MRKNKSILPLYNKNGMELMCNFHNELLLIINIYNNKYYCVRQFTTFTKVTVSHKRDEICQKEKTSLNIEQNGSESLRILDIPFEK